MHLPLPQSLSCYLFDSSKLPPYRHIHGQRSIIISLKILFSHTHESSPYALNFLLYTMKLKDSVLPLVLFFRNKKTLRKSLCAVWHSQHVQNELLGHSAVFIYCIRSQLEELQQQSEHMQEDALHLLATTTFAGCVQAHFRWYSKEPTRSIKAYVAQYRIRLSQS